MKKVLFLSVSVAALAAGAVCQAVPPSYGESTLAYKGEIKGEAPALVNADYLGDIAGSKAVRKGDHLAEAAIDKANQGLSHREAIEGGGGVRFASPTIYGTVRGDVTIVVQRGAVRGSVTSISR